MYKQCVPQNKQHCSNKGNALKGSGSFIRLKDYVKKLSCMNGNIVIVGDFNIDWLNTNGSERKQFCNVLETFGFVQNICTETHRSHHLLDYIITRKDCNIISDFLVSDFISDHRALHASLYTSSPCSETDISQSN